MGGGTRETQHAPPTTPSLPSPFSAFPALTPLSRKRLTDGLASGTSVVAASAAALLATPPTAPADRDAQASLHRSALKAYTFFLAWLQTQADEEAAAGGGGGAAAAAAPRGRSKKGAAALPASLWTFDAARDRVARAWASLADTDLAALFAPAPVSDGLLARWVAGAVAVLAAPAGARDRATKAAAFKSLIAAAANHGQGEAVASAAVDALRRGEHLPAPLADLAAAAAEATGDDRLAVDLLRAVACADPASYEAAADAPAARAAGALLVELADRAPRAVCGHVSLLVPHLGGKAHALRSGVVGAMAVLVHKACSDPDAADGGEGGARDEREPPSALVARLRTKQHLLETLAERARDTSAFTRARVLGAWAYLADKGSLPLGHWDAVTQLAVDRLEDKAALVRRAALQLLSALMLYNPFGPALPRDRFEASLAEYEGVLVAADAERRASQRGGEGDADATAAASSFDAGVVKMEASADGDAAREAAAEAAADAAAVEADADAAADAAAPHDPALDQTRALVASLRCASMFAATLTGALPAVVQLLASATLTDVTEALALLACARRFALDGADAALRQALPLVFSREPGVPDAVVSTLDDLYLAGRPADAAAAALVDLGVRASLADAASLDELVGRLMAGDEPRARPAALRALWPLTAALAQAAAPGASTREDALPRLRAALAVMASVARRSPGPAADNLPLLLHAGFAMRDAGCVRGAGACLQAAAGAAAGADTAQVERAARALVATLLAPPSSPTAGLPDAGWYGAADACLRALLALHPAPQAAAAAVLRGAASRAATAVAARSRRAPAAVARLLFLASRVALAQLVAADTHARSARKARLTADMAADAEGGGGGRAAAAATAASPSDDDDDVAAQVGPAGAAAADANLEALRDAAEAGVLAPGAPAGALAPAVVAACADAAALAAHPALAAAAPLALATLMAVDGAVCEAHLGALFAAAADPRLPPRARSTLAVAAGDLAVRFPNAVEPWTAALYAPLTSADARVRRDALLVLSHLVLNDMVKVKGHAAALAARVVDPDPRTAALAALFFHELAARAHKGAHPVYNLVPDVLSSLAADASISQPNFQTIMRSLLAHVGKEKHGDGLVDKLLPRLSRGAPRAAARGAAFCLAQLALSEKGVRKVVDGLPLYRHWLGDADVAASVRASAARGRRLAKASGGLKADLDAWEERVDAAVAELGEAAVAAEGGADAADAAPAADENAPAAPAASEDASGLASPTGVTAAARAVRRLSLVGDSPPARAPLADAGNAAPSPSPAKAAPSPAASARSGAMVE